MKKTIIPPAAARPHHEETAAAEALIAGGGTAVGQGILLKELSFRYGGRTSPKILQDISLFIPAGKVTAIVGSSGSGKTTLLKLLLKFYPLAEGTVFVDNTDINHLSAREWRKKCGTVMQEGYIFSDTIGRNIAVNEDSETVDRGKLLHALRVAQLDDFVNNLPLGTDTPIGATGQGLSGGQRQRMLIARAIYKDPDYLLFDEATSALDANTEKAIMQQLDRFFKGRTVVVIAHRLSTVKNADQIVVLDNGRIIETGTHYELALKGGKYYELIKNQLDLEAYAP